MTSFLHRLLRQAKGRRRHIRNAWWSALRYGMQPILLIVGTPLLVKMLGTSQYGLWAFMSTIAGLGGVANLGMSQVALKYVSGARGREDRAEAVRVVQVCTTFTLAGGLLLTTLLVAFSHLLARTVFSKMGATANVQLAFGLAGFLLLCAQLGQVYGQSIRGSERFDIEGRLHILYRTFFVFSNVAVAWIYRDVRPVLLMTAGAAFAGMFIKAVFATRLLGGWVFLPRWHRETVHEIFGFGLWSWLQGVAGMVFQQADRVVVGSLLGATSFTYYTVSMQLAKQVHAIPAATLELTLPWVSRKTESSSWDSLKKGRRVASTVNIVLAVGLGSLLLLFGPDILALWMGREFAGHASNVLLWLVLPYLLLSLSIVPWYFILGYGHARFVALNSSIAAALGVAVAFLLIPIMGLPGAALSRVAYAVAALFSYWKLRTIMSKQGAGVAMRPQATGQTAVPTTAE